MWGVTGNFQMPRPRFDSFSFSLYIQANASTPLTAEAGGVLFVCHVNANTTSQKQLSDFLQIWHKRPLRPKNELIGYRGGSKFTMTSRQRCFGNARWEPPLYVQWTGSSSVCSTLFCAGFDKWGHSVRGILKRVAAVSRSSPDVWVCSLKTFDVRRWESVWVCVCWCWCCLHLYNFIMH